MIISPAGNPHERALDLDWARLIAVLLLIPFHAAAVFYSGELGVFYVVNPQKSAALAGLVQFLYQWHMPLLFFLAGSACWHSLQLPPLSGKLTPLSCVHPGA